MPNTIAGAVATGVGLEKPRGAQTGGISKLMYAAQQADVDTLRRIIHDQPRSIQEKDRNGRSALHYCCTDSTLASHAADVVAMAAPELIEGRDEDGLTPLHLAAIAGNISLLTFLVANNADVNAVDNEMHTVVHWATVCGENEALRIVLAAGAPVSTPDVHKGYPLHYAAQMCGGLEKDANLGLQVLQTLLSHVDADVNVEDGDGRRPLLWAASAGSAKAVLALIRSGCAVESSDKDGLTALHCAASRGHTECIDTLLNLCGASVDVIDSNGCTALHYAVTLGHADATALLLAHGADANRQDRKGRSPAHCGCSKGQFETVKMIGMHGANLWLRNARGDLPLHEASASGRRDLVKWLLAMRPSQVNARNNDGRCPLHLAALNDNADMCKILLDAGAQINPILRTSKNQLMTPLDCALQRGFRSTAKYLQVHGAAPATRLTNRPRHASSALSLQIRDDVTLVGESTSDSERENDVVDVKQTTPAVAATPSAPDARKKSKNRLNYSNEITINGNTEINIHQTREISVGRGGVAALTKAESCAEARKRRAKSRSRSSQAKNHIESAAERRSSLKKLRDRSTNTSEETVIENRAKSVVFDRAEEDCEQSRKIVVEAAVHEPPKIIEKSRTKQEETGDLLESSKTDQVTGETEAPGIQEPIAETPSTEQHIKRSKAPSTDQPPAETRASSTDQPLAETKVQSTDQLVEKTTTSTDPLTQKTEAPSTDPHKEKTKSPSIDQPTEETKAQTTNPPKEKTSSTERHLSETKAPSADQPTEQTETSNVAQGREETKASSEQQTQIEHAEVESPSDQMIIERTTNGDTPTTEIISTNGNGRTIDTISLHISQEIKASIPINGTPTVSAEKTPEPKRETNGADITEEKRAAAEASPEVQEETASKTDAETPQQPTRSKIESETSQQPKRSKADAEASSQQPTKAKTDAEAPPQPSKETARKERAKTDEQTPKQPKEKPKGIRKIKEQEKDESKTSEDVFTSLQSDSSTSSLVTKTHKSFRVLDEDEDAETKKKFRKQRSKSEDAKYSKDIERSEKKSKIPLLKSSMSKSDRHLDSDGNLEINVNDLNHQRADSHVSAPLLPADSDERDSNTDEERLVVSRRKKIRKKQTRRDSKSAGSDYDSNVIDSGFEPSPRSTRIPKWRNVSERGVNMTSVTQSVQSNIRRYHLERKIFQHLLELKRLQIRSGQHNESILVKRAIDQYHQSCAATVGAGRYVPQDFSFKSFEKFLYSSLRKLQKDDMEHLKGLPAAPSNPLLCTRSTHRCMHATHAYTGVPCAAYLPKIDHHTIPKIGFDDCKPGTGFLPNINPKKAVTLELCHGEDKQVISLPADRLDQNKRYYVTFTVKGNELPRSAGDVHRHARSD